MSKQLTIEVTDKQYDLFKRIAFEDNRKLNDLIRLVFITGIDFHWSENYFSFKKRDDEFTPQERKQMAKNEKILKQLEKEDKPFYQLSDEEKEKLGYKSVEEWHRGGGYEDSKTNLCSLLSEELKAVLIDQEVN
tara:strand:- start:815 stop:1216 length:402 start_codon:yes stop_codon:yes gene_type:complete